MSFPVLHRLLLLTFLLLCGTTFCVPAIAQDADQTASADATAALLKRLEAAEARMQAQDARIQELERRLHQRETASAPVQSPQTPTPEEAQSVDQPSPISQPATEGHSHMEAGPGPSLNIRGFTDVNAGIGNAAGPMSYPLGASGKATFQLGQFDLFVSSKLSDNLSFMSEVAIGSSPTNAWDLDIERVQLTYTPSDYLSISGGRYHTAIGYYNTAFHHGNWFQTATGRPFMYFFEDDGGPLPVHSVGLSLSGLVPGTRKLGLHWVAETTNGRASDREKEAVQNFLADKDGKGFNLAAYIAPERWRGLQIGGSFYHDRLKPTGLGHVDQNIASLYAVYVTPTWEFLNEGVLLTHKAEETGVMFRNPMAYTQLSRKFGAYRPYIRYQYMNSPASDPLNTYLGKIMGPSIGIRWDVADYAAFKLQYNRFTQTGVRVANGLDAQMAFTF